MFKDTINLLLRIIENGNLPEFDSYYDECSESSIWVCSFYGFSSFTPGATRKHICENVNFDDLIKDVYNTIKKTSR